MTEKKEKILDLVIVGAAAAGSAAAIYAARRNLNFIVVAKDVGGEVALSGEIGNWPGIIETTGIELAKNFHEHLKSYRVEIETGFLVTSITHKNKVHTVKVKSANGKEKEFKTKAVIVATGIHPRSLNIPGEAKFRGKGITYCTVCDGPLFSGKTTASIGAGNSALESALMMSGIAKKVYLVTKYPNDKKHNGGFPKGENILIDKVKKTKNIKVIYNALTTKATGDKLLKQIEYKDEKTGKTNSLKVEGAMVHIGMIPNSDFVTCGKKNKFGEIEVDIKCQTDCPGVFAAGDVTNIPYKQITISAGHGATAALAAIEYINKWKA